MGTRKKGLDNTIIATSGFEPRFHALETRDLTGVSMLGSLETCSMFINEKVDISNKPGPLLKIHGFGANGKGGFDRHHGHKGAQILHCGFVALVCFYFIREKFRCCKLKRRIENLTRCSSCV